MLDHPSPEFRAAADLSGRTALVAGGTRGIGRSIARLLAQAGAGVAVSGRSQDAGAEAVSEFAGAGQRAVFVRADVTDPASAAAMTREVSEALGPIDIAVVCGGSSAQMPVAKPFLDIDPATYPTYFSGQLFSRLNVLGAVLPGMCERGYGKVVIVSSDAGRVPTPGEALFGAACAAAQFSVRALSREVARHGVRINAVSITLTRDSGTWDRFQDGDIAGNTLGRVFEKIEARAPFGLNSPRDVAEAVGFLASPASDQITGATLSVNGGISTP